MKRSDKIKYTINPRALESKLSKLIVDFNSEWNYDSYNYNPEFVDILSNIPFSKIKKIFDKYYFRPFLDDNTPSELLNNKEFVYYAIKKNIHNICYIKEEYITQECIDLLVENMDESTYAIIDIDKIGFIFKYDKVVEGIIRNHSKIESYDLNKYINDIYKYNRKYFERFINVLVENNELTMYALSYVQSKEIKDYIFNNIDSVRKIKYLVIGNYEYFKEEEIEKLTEEEKHHLLEQLLYNNGNIKLKSKSLYTYALSSEYYGPIITEKLTVDSLSVDEIYDYCIKNKNNYEFFYNLNLFKFIDFNAIDISDLDKVISILEMYNNINCLSDKHLNLSNKELLYSMLERKVNLTILSYAFSKSLFDSETINIIYNNYDHEDFRLFVETSKIDYDKLKINITEEQLLKKLNSYYDKYYKNIDPQLCINPLEMIDLFLVIQQLQKINLNEEEKQKIKNIVIKIKKQLHNYNLSRNNYDELIDLIVDGKRNPFVFMFTNSFVPDMQKVIDFIVKYCNIYDRNNTVNVIKSMPGELLNNANKKHILEIIKLLKDFDIEESTVISLAFKIYMTLGYERSVSFLSKDPKKNYGLATKDILIEMFKDISLHDTLLVQKDNSYVPSLNDKLINMIFGNSNKVLNTPIRNVLLNNEPRLKELEIEKARIMSNPDLTEEEKKNAIELATKKCNKYLESILKFVKAFSICYNKWDIIEEEFYKKENKSSLKLKLNVDIILEILTNINAVSCELNEVIDKELIESKVFDYVGIDNKFVSNVSTVKQRAVYLSREMSKVKYKKFPNVQIKEGNLTIRVYGPQDRNILCAGHRSGCCFRPNGNADDSGKNTSLLTYCCTTEYGGGVEIVDEDDNIIMFSPLLRNGNVLMIHSIETLNPSKFDDKAASLLERFAKKVIEESSLSGDNIEFVTLTNLHHVERINSIGLLPRDNKFRIYDENGSFYGMYTNLSNEHMVLAKKEGKSFEDISYGKVKHSYNYNVEDSKDIFKHVNIDPEMIKQVSELLKLKDLIMRLTNERRKLIFNSKDANTYGLLAEIKEKKREYLSKYSSLLKKHKGQDMLKEISSIFDFIIKCDKEGNYVRKIDDLAKYSTISYSESFCILIGPNGKITVISNEELDQNNLNKIEEIKELYGHKEKVGVPINNEGNLHLNDIYNDGNIL